MPVKIGILIDNNTGEIHSVRSSDTTVEVLVSTVNPSVEKGVYAKAMNADRLAILELPHEVWS